MKLSKAQLEYIQSKRRKMDARMKDLDSFGDDIYKSAKLCAERGRIHYDKWFFNHLLELHQVEVDAEKASFDALCAAVEEEFKDGVVK